MNILITGGTGYLGGRIAQHLSALGHNITLTVRPEAIPPAWCNGISIKEMNVLAPASIEHCCFGQDIVLHTAGMNAQNCKLDPAAAIEFNGAFTARLAIAAENAGVQKFFFFSTAHVYKSPLEGVITEITCAINQHPYAFSKRAGESALLDIHKRGKMSVAVLRLSNIIGAPAHAGVNTWMLLVNDICRQAVATQQIVLHTHGQQLRDFLGMNSLLSIVSNMLLFDLIKYNEPVFNIGSAKSISVLQMAELVSNRYELLFSSPVEIRIPTGTSMSQQLPDPLIYSTLYPETTFGVQLDYTAEIDELLIYCKKQQCKNSNAK